MFTTLQPDQTSATYKGQAGHTYRFYSTATDNAGNVQPGSPSSAVAITVVAPPSSPPLSPSPAAPSPYVISEEPVFLRKTNKKGKPLGKPALIGFTFHFNTPLDGSSASNSNNYVIDEITLKGQNKKVQRVLHPITGFSAASSAAGDAVTLTFAGTPTFSTGGQITLIGGPGGGIVGQSGAALTGSTVFAIAADGRKITAG